MSKEVQKVGMTCDHLNEDNGVSSKDEQEVACGYLNEDYGGCKHNGR